MKNFSLYCTTSLAMVIVYALSTNFALALTGLAAGNDDADGIGKFLSGVLGFIDQILIPVILGLAFLMFIWGVFKYFILGGADEEAQASGRSLMLYAIAGFVLILSFYGIVSVITNGLGFGGDTSLNDAGTITTGFDTTTGGGDGGGRR